MDQGQIAAITGVPKRCVQRYTKLGLIGHTDTSEGNANDIAQKETFIPFDNTRFEKIKTASQVFVTVAFSTYNNAQVQVKVLASQEVQIRMGMKVGLN